MKFISFTADGRASYGLAVDGGVADLGVRNAIVPTLKTYQHAVALGLVKARMTGHEVDYADGEFRHDAAIPNPKKILCIDLDCPGRQVRRSRHIARLSSASPIRSSGMAPRSDCRGYRARSTMEGRLRW
jgi:hypothetical protein